MILLEPSGSKEAVDSEKSGNWTGFNSGAHALSSYICQDEPTISPFQRLECMQEDHFSLLWTRVAFLLAGIAMSS